MNIWSELAKPFPEPEIHWRIGATNIDRKNKRLKWGDKPQAIPLAYIDARNVMERLDLVVGPDNWQDDYPYKGCCRIGIKVSATIFQYENEALVRKYEGEWIWRSDNAGETDVEAEKGQSSDAFKRAGVKFGIGRYLYQLPNTWVELDDKWRNFKVQPKLPAWATPNGWNKIGQSEKKAFYEQMLTCLEKMDEYGVRELVSEYDADQQIQLWSMFDSKQRDLIKKLKADK